ncbi:MAG: hypothetical protein U0798_10360 [Gemmataceae bacterium]
MDRLLASVILLGCFVMMARGQEIGFAEEFALSKDRNKALQSLIPSTEDYYYYHCLHYLNTEQYDKAESLFKPWLEKFNQTNRLTELQFRHALLTYNRNPEKSLNYLKRTYGLDFNHQKQILGGSPNLPIALDPKLISRDTLKARAYSHNNLLNSFEDSALTWLGNEPFANADLRRNFLQRLPWPDTPNLPRMIADDFASPNSGGFGSLPIHNLLTTAQLEELLKLRPELKDQGNYVNARLIRLQPGADENWRENPERTRAYFDRLLAYTRTLAPVHNQLKAHVLYHRLAFDQSRGTYDRDRFLEYLALPRMQHYMSRQMLENDPNRQYPANLNADYSSLTLMPPVHSDEPLVRSILKHFFINADSSKAFEPYINDQYLKHLFAETKIERGLGDTERWAADLPPDAYAQLKERVDIDFAATNKTHFAADEAVSLDLHVKNVPTLIVKVFEINTVNYFRDHKREIETDVNLDGLVANSEQTLTYSEAPVRRIDRKFDFPQLTKPGVYVVDFIGGGKSSRALIRKGKLRPLVSTSTAGQIVRVVDDKNQPVPTASIWMGGREYNAEKDGAILLPFSSSLSRQPIVIRKGDFACLDFLIHQAESYTLRAGIHVDREALLSQRLAVLAIRPGVYLNGKPVSVSLLEEPKLRITAIDQDGIATNSEVPDVRLFEDRETTHEFRVPSRLTSLTVTLEAKIKVISSGAKVDLSASQSFTLNAINKTDKIEDLHFAKFGNDYVLELLGRTGEAKADRPVHFQFKHRDFREPVSVTLKTNESGRIQLGSLVGIANVMATGPEGTAHGWSLPLDHCTYRQVIHAKAGDVITLPYIGSVGEPTRAELALFAMLGSTIREDKFDAISIRNNMIELAGLTAGDYDLLIKSTGEKIRIRVVDGPIVAGHVLGTTRHLEVSPLKPVQISSITADAETVTIKLADGSKFARVHVYASRYLPAYSAYAHFSNVRDAELSGVYPGSSESTYLTGRNIGDEYRYVLDRKLQKKYPGNMLDRPQLLLNPWAVRVTETGEQLAQGGEAFGTTGAPKPSAAVPPAAKSAGGDPGKQAAMDAGQFANLDFLAEIGVEILNLVPDDKGTIKVPRKALGSKSMFFAVAVDPLHTVVKSFTLPESPAAAIDLRLLNGLDPKGHFTQQKQVTVLNAGQPFVLADAAGSRFEAYDSLAKQHALYATLTKDPRMSEFAFLLNWPKLKQEEKQTLYSKHACHELSFFLFKKDPAFFNAVVKTYLANKKDKTFIDHFLLGDDLSEFVSPWKYQRLNTAERVLLGQKLPGEAAKTARFLADLYRLQPPNLDRDQMLFEFAVKGSDLATNRPGRDAPTVYRNATLGGGGFGGGIGGIGGGGIGGGQFGGGMAPGGGGGGGRMPGGVGGPGGPPAATGVIPQSDAPAAADKMDDRVGGKGSMSRRDGDAKLKKAMKENETLNGLREMNKPGESPELPELKVEQKFFAEERKRLEAQILYRKIDPTSEWAENNYDKLPIQMQLSNLVTVNPFWVDYSKHEGNGPFLSRNLNRAANNFTEAMFALAVTDLPFEAGKHDYKFDAGKMTFTPAGPVIAFHEEVKPVGNVAGNLPILVTQNFYRHGDRYRDENGERLDKFIKDEFVVHTAYGCQVVVTNPSPSRQKLAVLVQIPVGSLPLAGAQPTKTILLDLEPYRTGTIDVLFYFPQAGEFDQFPVHVAKNEQLVAAGTPFHFHVVNKPSKLDTTSWEYVSQNGSNDDVLAFLNRENVHALNLEMIAFRMKEAKFFETVLAVLQDRHAYHQTLMSYGVMHNMPSAVQQFLRNAGPSIGGPLTSPLYTYDPVERYEYEHLEYKPLVNARAHSLGKQRQIVNSRVNFQYHQLLNNLSYRGTLTDNDHLAATYYLLLQDRIDEASEHFAAVNVEKISTRLQYDYCSAYLALSHDDLAKARAVAMKHVNHPIDRWKNLFTSVINVLDEAEGKGAKVADAEDRNQQQAKAAASDPTIDFTVENKAINLTWANVGEVTVNYYLMDVELLFSRNPFVQQTGGQFSMIRPNATKTVKLAAGAKKMSIPLPDDLVKRNVLVEITAAGKSKSVPYYANAMDVKLIENFGQVKVTNASTGKPLSKVYVKTYVRMQDGTVKFHKDGYTDARGRFDYATVSTPERSAPARYSVLILSDEFGAVIREADPPKE